MRILAIVAALLAVAPIRAEESHPPISVRAFFANPTYSSPRISPDGETLAVLLSSGDAQAIVSRPRAGGAFTVLAKLVDPAVRVDWLEWASNTRLLMSATQRREVGNESYRHRFLYGVDRDGANFRWLGEHWPRVGQALIPIQDNVIHWLPDDPDHVLLELWDFSDAGPRVFKMNVHTGKIGTRQRDENGITTWFADRAGDVRAGQSINRNLRYVLWAKRPGEKFLTEVSRHTLYSDDPGVAFAGFHDDPGKLYAFASREGRDAVFEFDIATKQLGKLVFAHPEVDVEALVRAVTPDRRVIGAYVTTDAPTIEFFDAERASEWKELQRVFASEFGRPVFHEVVSASEDGRFVLFRVRSDVQASSYYAYDREQKALSHLVDQHPELPAERMSPMQSIAYTARDGLRISGYLTLPNGRGGKNLPAIVLPHGGPFARDVRDWNAEVQFLASRGFAVLQPNFRGSSGFGRAFERSGYRQWGLAMQDDISDGVKWLVEQGIADPDRIGIYGASYGGYAALVGGTKTASLYRAAAAYAPVVDLELMIDDEASYRGYVPYAETQIGGELGDKERLRANSPLRLAEQAGVPILLGHGDEDDVVDVHHSRKMAAALRKAGKPFEYLEFPHEIHGFLLESNRIRWYEALAAFFEKHLAQRAANTAAAGAAP